MQPEFRGPARETILAWSISDTASPSGAYRLQGAWGEQGSRHATIVERNGQFDSDSAAGTRIPHLYKCGILVHRRATTSGHAKTASGPEFAQIILAGVVRP